LKRGGVIVKTKKHLWLPAGLGIVYILFISLFALDAFEGDASLLEKIGGFIIHLRPSFISLAALAVSWKKPAAGGVLFVLLSVAFTLYFRTYRSLPSFLAISIPLAVIGLLFITLQAAENKRKDGGKKL
jgi:hypothetical protein